MGTQEVLTQEVRGGRRDRDSRQEEAMTGSNPTGGVRFSQKKKTRKPIPVEETAYKRPVGRRSTVGV